MAIDNRIDAIEKQIAAEEREHSPVTDHLASLASEVIPGVGTIRDFLERHREENRTLLIEALKMEIHDLISRMSDLEIRHQEFLQGEFMGLVLDGLKKAEDARTVERVRYLAAILANSAKAGPDFSADETEALMRLVLELNEFDLRVLQHLSQLRPGHDGYAGGNPAPIVKDLDIWAGLAGAAVGSRNEGVQSACLKLQSMGLITLDIANTTMDGTLTFRILRRGVDLLRIIASTA